MPEKKAEFTSQYPSSTEPVLGMALLDPDGATHYVGDPAYQDHTRYLMQRFDGWATPIGRLAMRTSDDGQ